MNVLALPLDNRAQFADRPMESFVAVANRFSLGCLPVDCSAQFGDIPLESIVGAPNGLTLLGLQANRLSQLNHFVLKSTGTAVLLMESCDRRVALRKGCCQLFRPIGPLIEQARQFADAGIPPRNFIDDRPNGG